MDLAPEGSRYMQKTVSWLELARIPRSGRGWFEVFGVIEPQFLNLPDEVISLIHLTSKGYKEGQLIFGQALLPSVRLGLCARI